MTAYCLPKESFDDSVLNNKQLFRSGEKMKKIGIIDYGMGNLCSVRNALDYIGAECFISGEEKELERADGFILPGVGAFPDAAQKLEETGLSAFIKERRKERPLLGICLGMQLLFENGYEFRHCKGLALIKGDVVRLQAGEKNKKYKIPHIGYNSVTSVNSSPITAGIDEGSYFYFVHSYKGVCSDRGQLASVTEYGEEVTAIVSAGNVFGTQFHPEKSGEVGLALLKNFTNLL